MNLEKTGKYQYFQVFFHLGMFWEIQGYRKWWICYKKGNLRCFFIKINKKTCQNSILQFESLRPTWKSCCTYYVIIDGYRSSYIFPYMEIVPCMVTHRHKMCYHIWKYIKNFQDNAPKFEFDLLLYIYDQIRI